MTTMGVTVYCNRVQINGDQEQLMLLRTLQDNGSNILGSSPHLIVQKGLNMNMKLDHGSSNNNIVLPPYDPTRLKKHGKNGQPPPVAVAKRNARERNRVKQVNNGFATLRQHIPNYIAAGYGDRGKKLSKVETLRMAVEYIRGLQRLLAEADGVEFDSGSHNIPSPSSSISGHNGLSPAAATSPKNLYPAGDEENLEPVIPVQNFARLSPSLASPATEYYQNEENLEPQILSPYSGAGDSEEGGTIYAASPEGFGTIYYKQEISDTGEFMDVVSWWEQEQGRLVHTQPHTQRLTHV
ncbi:Similar to ac: Achaete-scute complex protein T5 (Drosophila melanogaster) [Cotesia congregata]|uniref:Similar to ac: Achaete-scute complex protein T5 (Drosophila melanogaster) n=1 Tax=Cotesia congregata TaxID=51543 RepID=A0A8J2H637_COTCN|nr:Similar to ac: Achaete-scute complex protein T5 (Drosophila melanogaster) [Cotesia congregata]